MLLAMADPAATPVWLSSLGLTGVYILVGVVLLVVSAIVTDLLTPGRLWEEVSEKKNLSLGIVTAGFWIGDALIIAAVISGGGGADHSRLIPFSALQDVNLLLNTLAYGLIGILAKAVLYKLFDLLTPSVSFKSQLEGNNAPFGVVLAGMNVALSVIIAAGVS